MPNSSLETLPAADDLDRCQHIDAQGRRCRMFVAPAEKTFGASSAGALGSSASELCAHHAQQLVRRLRATETTAAELLASVTDFGEAASVNHFLGNLIKLVALKRIPRRDAVTLAYISQLILHSQAAEGRGQLLNLQVEELRRKLAPAPRVIWDIPRYRSGPEQSTDSKLSENPAVNPAGTNTGQ